MAYTKITQEDLADKGVIGLADTPNLSTQKMQEKFDEIALDVIVPKFNNLVDELDDSHIETKIDSTNITDLKINTDLAIEYSDDGGLTFKPTASSGHRIMDGSGTIYSQRSRLQFSNNVTIQDDENNNKTVLLFQPGEKGDKGDAATITIGNVQEGQTMAVTNSGSATDAILNFTLKKGDAGESATIQVGTVTGGASASVTNRGTNSNAIFDFVLPKGDKGDVGQGLTVLGEYATLADLQTAHPTGNPGNAYLVGTTNPKDLYIWDTGTLAWKNQGQLQGAKGDTGDAATITVGTVTSGSTASVVNSGTTSAAILDFVLEKGDKGDDGDTGTIAVGNVTSGQTASVTNVGTPTAAVFDFVLPKGDTGAQGNPTVVNGKSGNNVTLYGSDINLGDGENAKSISETIAPVESGTLASQAYSKGDQFIFGGQLVRASADITSGQQIVEGSGGNCVASYDLVTQLSGRYTTAEKIVGTWIDGRPLYEKTISTRIPTVQTQGTAVSTFVDMNTDVLYYIDIRGIAQLTSAGVSIVAPYAQAATGFTDFLTLIGYTKSTSANANTIRISCNETAWSNAVMHITVKYIKEV